QRPAAVQPARDQTGDELTQRRHRPGAGQCGPAYVVGEVEPVVIDPDWRAEHAWHALNALPVTRDAADPPGAHPTQPLVVQTCGGRLEDRERADLPRSGRRFLRKQRDVG